MSHWISLALVQTPNCCVRIRFGTSSSDTLTATKMSFPRVQELSVSMERRSTHRSKHGDRERMNTSSCAEFLMSVNSSTASKNKLASLLTFVCRKKPAVWQYHFDSVESYNAREQLINTQFPYQDKCT